MSGQTLQQYILPLAAGVQAVFTSSGLSNYRHADWLGTSRLSLDTIGNLYVSPLLRAVRRGLQRRHRQRRAGRQRPLLHRTDPGRDCRPDGHLRFPLPPARLVAGTLAGADPAGLAAVDITRRKGLDVRKITLLPRGEKCFLLTSPLQELIELPPLLSGGRVSPPVSGACGAVDCGISARSIHYLCRYSFGRTSAFDRRAGLGGEPWR